MIAARCTVCGADVKVPSQFDIDGPCPECDADDGCLVVEDDYSPAIRELRCAECGWEVEAGVQVELADGPRTFTVDDDCIVCEQAGYPNQVLAPAETVSVRDQPEYPVARAAAIRTRDEHGSTAIPVDVEGIASALGLTVVRRPFAHDGMLSGTTIEVPIRDEHPGAQRFVIAHEIGHYVLRHEGGRAKIEPEANAFASELIIPRDDLRRQLREPRYLTQLARTFQVSRQAMFYAVSSARVTSQLAG